MNLSFFKVIIEEIKYLPGSCKEIGKYLFFNDKKWRAGSLAENGGLEWCQTASFRVVDGFCMSWSTSMFRLHACTFRIRMKTILTLFLCKVKDFGGFRILDRWHQRGGNLMFCL